MECSARGVGQASGWQAWKRLGQIMMMINARVTSLAGGTVLVLKGRESGVGSAATVGCKDNGSRDINMSHQRLISRFLMNGMTERTELATRGLNSITCCRKSCNFSWKLKQSLIKRPDVLLNYPENQCCGCLIFVSFFFFLIASDLIWCFWLASSSRWDIQQIRGIFYFFYYFFFYQEPCEVQCDRAQRALAASLEDKSVSLDRYTGALQGSTNLIDGTVYS